MYQNSSPEFHLLPFTDTTMFYLFANCNFIPDHYAAWQAAYDDLAAYVEPNEPNTQTYYFGIPMDYAGEVERTTSMLAFEVYGRREVSLR